SCPLLLICPRISWLARRAVMQYTLMPVCLKLTENESFWVGRFRPATPNRWIGLAWEAVIRRG
ncbi:MAG TPA: hypothetical protein VKX46_22315, partial [Ktedonobacteraceae bacterium]|nr:hypothetical protein [Ktedonobacteraceae bacterium]